MKQLEKWLMEVFESARHISRKRLHHEARMANLSEAQAEVAIDMLLESGEVIEFADGQWILSSCIKRSGE